MRIFTLGPSPVASRFERVLARIKPPICRAASSREKTGGRFFSNCSKKIVSGLVLLMFTMPPSSFAYHIGLQWPDGARLMQIDATERSAGKNGQEPAAFSPHITRPPLPDVSALHHDHSSHTHERRQSGPSRAPDGASLNPPSVNT